MNFLDKYFKLTENKTNVRTEVIAGITTFITMAYIIFVNPNILKLAGMNSANALGDNAAKFNAFNDPVVASVLAATCLAAAIGTLVMGLYANYPFAQAPGMGLNAFFTFTIVLGMGYNWHQALAAVFISGIIFILITVTKLREMIVDAIPMTLKHAVTGGIGLFIALVGFKNAGIVTANPATIISFGNLTSPNTLLAIFGLIITGILMARNVRGSILLGIIITTIASVVTRVVTIPTGFKIFSAPPSLAPTFLQFDFAGLLHAGSSIGVLGALSSLLAVILSITLVDLFDTIGTLVGTGNKAGMLDKDGKLPRINKALLSDSIATTVGSILGTSTVVTYVESASGVMAGGKTGLTSVVTAFLFVLALFIAPLTGLVPPAATAPALIIVGVLMIGSLKQIDFDDMTEAIPAFLTVVMMPFSFSIANGIASGLIVYPIIKVATGKSKGIHPLVYILAILFVLRFIIMARYGG